jgi:hypothetical protein
VDRASRVHGGAWILVCALASACGEPRSDDGVTTALPTGVGGDSEATDPTSDSASSDGMPRLDVGSMVTTGVDPDGPISCDEDVDIVFVMDVSTSMDTFLDRLATEIAVVDQALAQIDLPSPPRYGLVVFVDDVALLQAGAPYPDVATLQSEFMQWSAFTSSNQQTSGGGFNNTWPENSLDALWVAATGFQWRPATSTLRMIIHTTDDTFWEGPGTYNGVNVMRNYAETVEALQERQIRVFSFAAHIGAMCNCEDVSAGWFNPYMGQAPIPEATDGGVFNIDEIITGAVSLSNSLEGAIDESICTPYEPIG